MRAKFFLAWLLLAGTMANAQTVVSLDAAIDNIYKEFYGVLSGKRVAVTNIESPTKRLSDDVINKLNMAFTNRSTNIDVVERRKLEAIEQEFKFQMTGMVSDDTLVSIGHFLGAQVIVTGEIKPLGSNYQFTAKVLDVETARILKMLMPVVNMTQNRLLSDFIAEDEWKYKWLYLGVFAGYGSGFGNPTFDDQIHYGIPVSLQFSDMFGIRAELQGTYFSSIFQENNFSFKAAGQFTLRPGDYDIAIFIGPFYALDLADSPSMYELNKDVLSVNSRPLPEWWFYGRKASGIGFYGGVEFGKHVKPGTFFVRADIESISGFGISAGYKNGFINRR